MKGDHVAHQGDSGAGRIWACPSGPITTKRISPAFGLLVDLHQLQ
jgi:hypothetical protein